MSCWKRCTGKDRDQSPVVGSRRRNAAVTSVTTISAIPPTSSTRWGFRSSSQIVTGGQKIFTSRRASRQVSTPERNPVAVASRRFFSGVIRKTSQFTPCLFLTASLTSQHEDQSRHDHHQPCHELQAKRSSQRVPQRLRRPRDTSLPNRSQAGQDAEEKHNCGGGIAPLCWSHRTSRQFRPPRSLERVNPRHALPDDQ